MVRKFVGSFLALAVVAAPSISWSVASSPASFEDGAYAVLGGKVASIDGDEFMLDYGDGTIKVEMEAWPWEAEAMSKALRVGDQVTVTGEIDDGWFDERELEADDIYVMREFTYFVLEPNPNPAYSRSSSTRSEDGTFISARGEVTNIDGQEITIRSKSRELQVDTAEAQFDVSRLAIGDRVFVEGEIDDGFWDEREISADSIVKIDDVNGTKKSAARESTDQGAS